MHPVPTSSTSHQHPTCSHASQKPHRQQNSSKQSNTPSKPHFPFIAILQRNPQQTEIARPTILSTPTVPSSPFFTRLVQRNPGTTPPQHLPSHLATRPCSPHISSVNYAMGVLHTCTHPGCKKQFDRKYNLKCHLRIHSNEKPYRCHHAHCTRSFRWKSSLNHHLMSLDHTPVAARRERKVRAAKRRQEQLHATAATAAAADSVRNFGNGLHQQQHLQDDALQRFVPVTHQRQQDKNTTTTLFTCLPFALDTARGLDLPDVSARSALNTHSLNRHTIQIHNNDANNNKSALLSLPKQQQKYSNPLTEDMPRPTYDCANPDRFQLPPSLIAPCLRQNTLRRPHPSVSWAQQRQHHQPCAPNTTARRLSHPQTSHSHSHDFPIPLDRTDTSLAESNKPMVIISTESTLEPPLGSLCASLAQPYEKKEGNVGTSTVSQSCVIPTDVAPLFIESDSPKEPGPLKQGVQTNLACNQKMSATTTPLVSVFEDCSPSSLLSTVGPALDPLFGTCTFDAQSLRSL